MDLSDFSNANWPIRLRFSTPPGQICIRYDGKDALELYGNCKRAGVCQLLAAYGLASSDLTVSSC